MAKRRNNILTLILMGLTSCSPNTKENDLPRDSFIKREVSIFHVNCDSVLVWQHATKTTVDKKNIYSSLYFNRNLICKDSIKNLILINLPGNVNPIKINQLSLSFDSNTWFVYYTDSMEELAFIELKAENPFSTIYLTNNPQKKSILCELLDNDLFILNKIKLKNKDVFIPPNTN